MCLEGGENMADTRQYHVGPLERIDPVDEETFQPQHPDLKEEKRKQRNKARRERDQVMRDLGMKKVRGNLGGTHWE